MVQGFGLAALKSASGVSPMGWSSPSYAACSSVGRVDTALAVSAEPLAAAPDPDAGAALLVPVDAAGVSAHPARTSPAAMAIAHNRARFDLRLVIFDLPRRSEARNRSTRVVGLSDSPLIWWYEHTTLERDAQGQSGTVAWQWVCTADSARVASSNSPGLAQVTRYSLLRRTR